MSGIASKVWRNFTDSKYPPIAKPEQKAADKAKTTNRAITAKVRLCPNFIAPRLPRNAPPPSFSIAF
jgi:hypothetical protein